MNVSDMNWVQHPKDVVWSRTGTKENQKSRTLQILDMWDLVQQHLVIGCHFLQFLVDALWAA